MAEKSSVERIDSPPHCTNSGESEMEEDKPSASPGLTRTAASPTVGDRAATDWAENLEGVSSLLDKGQLPLEGAGPSATAMATTPQEGVAKSGPQQPQEGLGAKENEPKAGSSGTNIWQRASELVAKRKQAGQLMAKASLGDKLDTYEAIRKLAARENTVPILKGGTAEAADTGSFVSTGDGRLSRVIYTPRFAGRKNISYSFDYSKMRCASCEADPGHNMFRTSGGPESGREVVFLTDQAYPPCLPAGIGKKCVAIIRIEDGHLGDLASEFISVLRGSKMAAGSAVLMFSATHLAKHGAAAYAADLIGVCRRVKAAIGSHTVVGPLPPFLLTGTSDWGLIRGAVEVAAWAANVSTPEDTFMAESHLAAIEVLLDSGRGYQPDYATKMRMPASLSAQGDGKTWSSEGWHNLPTEVKAATPGSEKKVIEAVLGEVADKLAINLDTSPSLGRESASTIGSASSRSFLVVGSSNAERLAGAMAAKGATVTTVISPNWRVLKGSVDRLRALLEEEIQRSNPGCVILHLLDNTVFFAKSEDGSMVPARRGSDGRYHVDGELAIASKDTLCTMFKTLLPIMELIKGRKRVVVLPMPRYVVASCCGDRDHIPNRAEAGFYRGIQEGLATLCRTFRDFLFVSGMRDTVVFDPCITMRPLAASEIWGPDPVHPRPEIYGMLADDLKKVIDARGVKRSLEDAFGSSRGNRGSVGRGGHRGEASGGQRGQLHIHHKYGGHRGDQGRGGGRREDSPRRGGRGGSRGGRGYRRGRY